MKRLVAVILIVLAALGVRGESTPEIDSLIKVANTAPDTLKPYLYTTICWKVRNIDPQFGLRFGRIAVNIAQELGREADAALAYSYMGVCYKNAGMLDKALEYYEKSLNLNEKLNNKEQIAYSCINLANLYVNLHEPDRAKPYLIKVDTLNAELNNRRLASYYYLNTGRCYFMSGNYDSARIEFDKALNLRVQGYSDKGSERNVRRHIAYLNLATGDTTDAIHIFWDILNDSTDIDKPLLADVNNSMANIYLSRRMNDSAIIYADRAMAFANDIGSKQKIGAICHTQGLILLSKKDYSGAADKFQSELSFSEQVFNDQLNQGVVSTKYATESASRQKQLDNIAEEERAQTRLNMVLVIMLIMIVVVMIIFIFSNKRVKKLNDALDTQRRALDETNKRLMSSIMYARDIQHSVVSSEESVAELFPDSAVLYKPRDIVSGDWYLVESRRGLKIIVEADCTGHGIPGSLLSMMGMSALKDILNEMDLSGEELIPATILNRMRSVVKSMLMKYSEDGMKINDGMDLTIGIIDPETNIMRFGSAYQMAILVRNGEVLKLKGDRMPIGNYIREREFTSQEIQLQKGDALFFMSDGIKDQMNPKMEKFKEPRLDNFLLENINLPMVEIGKKLYETIEKWRDDFMQVDDMTMVGVRI
ncbi:MAG: SpoIIE family protein phosphatase [Bacteroidales bacterium]|nr:SpoIIE family protein phosphatase [Bacteroidales bacterium]